MKRKKHERELTPYQQELAEYRAFANQARRRYFAVRDGHPPVPWTDPTTEYQESDED